LDLALCIDTMEVKDGLIDPARVILSYAA